MDGYSRVTWVHILKQKSSAFEVIQSFVHMGQTRFEKQVKVTMHWSFMVYCANHYLLSQTSLTKQVVWIDQSKMEGREKTQEHLRNGHKPITLRFQSGLPLQFSGDCVLRVVKITNTSIMLNNKTPYDVLYNSLPSYTHLKPLEYLVLASKDKFNARRVPCLFLGILYRERV